MFYTCTLLYSMLFSVSPCEGLHLVACRAWKSWPCIVGPYIHSSFGGRCCSLTVPIKLLGNLLMHALSRTSKDKCAQQMTRVIFFSSTLQNKQFCNCIHQIWWWTPKLVRKKNKNGTIRCRKVPVDALQFIVVHDYSLKDLFQLMFFLATENHLTDSN